MPVWPCALSGRLPILALVGRYPTNKLIGRGLLFQRLATFPSRDYAVLAPVSQGYSTRKDRLPTCYSPVRHCTRGLLPFLVRLACVKRAASVDSEPGSNSHLMFVSLLHFAPALLGKLTNFFLTASNRIVKDPRSLPRHTECRSQRQASKLASRMAAPHRDAYRENLIKNQTGRPYSAPYGGPHGVLLPFLKEDLFLPHHLALASASSGVSQSSIGRLNQNIRDGASMQGPSQKEQKDSAPASPRHLLHASRNARLRIMFILPAPDVFAISSLAVWNAPHAGDDM